MKLAISMYSYYQTWKKGNWGIPDFIRQAKKAGAEGVELLDFFYKGQGTNSGNMTSDEVSEQREDALATLRETGLPCPIFSVAQNFAKEDPLERQVQLDKIKFGIDEALHYGAGVVRVFAGDVYGDITFDKARNWIIEGLSEASIYAAEKGVKLALENHGKLAGRGDQVRGIIEDVRARSGVDALGANPDTGNFLLVNQPSHQAMAQVAELANMVHFKDFLPEPAGHEGFAFEALNGEQFLGMAVGEGIVELGECIRILKDSGFDGWLSVEYEGEEDPLTAVPRSLANARRYL